nr:hypothetical protein [Flavobacterium ginsengisoli]
MTKGEETRQFIIEKAAPIFNTKGIASNFYERYYGGHEIV